MIAGAGAGFEQVPQATVLREQLLRAERHRALDARRLAERGDNGRDLVVDRQDAVRRRDAEAVRGDIQRDADSRPVQHQGGGGTSCATGAIRLSQHFQRMTLTDDCRFGFGLDRCQPAL